MEKQKIIEANELLKKIAHYEHEISRMQFIMDCFDSSNDVSNWSASGAFIEYTIVKSVNGISANKAVCRTNLVDAEMITRIAYLHNSLLRVELRKLNEKLEML